MFRRYLKNVNKKIIVTASIGVLAVISLILLHIFGHGLFPQESETAQKVSRLIQSFFVVLICFSAARLVLFCFILPIEKGKKTKIPALVKDTVYAVIFCIGAIIIIQNIYDESVFGIVSLLASSGVIVGIAAKGILEELINGLVLDFQNDFRVGDWVKFPDEKIAQILKMRLTGMDLLIVDGTRLTISNTFFKSQPIVHFDRTKEYFSISLRVTLKQNKMSFDQIKQIFSETPYEAFIENIKNGKITLSMDIPTSNSENWKQTLDCSISDILQKVNQHGLSIHSISGEHKFSKFKI